MTKPKHFIPISTIAAAAMFASWPSAAAEDILFTNAGVAEQVFLSATDDRICSRGAEAARAAIPKLSGSHSTVLGYLRGELIVRHDDQATVSFNHIVDNILPMADHMVDEIGSLL